MTMEFFKPLEMNQFSSDKIEPFFVLTCDKQRNMTNLPKSVLIIVRPEKVYCRFYIIIKKHNSYSDAYKIEEKVHSSKN